VLTVLALIREQQRQGLSLQWGQQHVLPAEVLVRHRRRCASAKRRAFEDRGARAIRKPYEKTRHHCCCCMFVSWGVGWGLTGRCKDSIFTCECNQNEESAGSHIHTHTHELFSFEKRRQLERHVHDTTKTTFKRLSKMLKYELF
jgi:hypothetical protein